MNIKQILMSPGAIVLTGLNDVNINNPTDRQVLTFNESSDKWENIAPGGVGRYTDRGDPTSWDFSKTDFSTDGQWHVLDLSSIVPEGATVVHLKIKAQIAYNNSIIAFCKKGMTNKLNGATLMIRHGNNEYYEERWVACDVDRKIEYWTSNRTWVILDVLVRGWI